MTLPGPRSEQAPAVGTLFAVTYLVVQQGDDVRGEGNGLRVLSSSPIRPLSVPRGTVVIRQEITIPESAFGPLYAHLTIAEPAVSTIEVRGAAL